MPAPCNPDEPAAAGQLLGPWRWRARREHRVVYIDRVTRDETRRDDSADSAEPTEPPASVEQPAAALAELAASVRRCPVCGGPITGARRTTRRYCSRACQQAAYRTRHPERDTAAGPSPRDRAPARCEDCHTPIDSAPTGRRPRYCSHACRQRAYRQRHASTSAPAAQQQPRSIS